MCLFMLDCVVSYALYFHSDRRVEELEKQGSRTSVTTSTGASSVSGAMLGYEGEVAKSGYAGPIVWERGLRMWELMIRPP